VKNRFQRLPFKCNLQRYAEVDARRGEQEYLLTFAAAAEDIKRTRRTADSGTAGGGAGRKQRAPGEPWQPPGGGVFLNPGPRAGQKTFNVYGQQSQDSWEAAAAVAGSGAGAGAGAGSGSGVVGSSGGGAGAGAGVSAAGGRRGPGVGDDPWEGSEFKRQMLSTLANKLLLKAVMGVFAAVGLYKLNPADW
jgi:hypothetical protein